MNKNRTILALDPGLRDLGFAVLRGPRLVAAGVRPLRLLPRSRRHAEARRLVADWIRAYRPRVLVLEATYRHPVPGFAALHCLARASRRIARTARIEIAEYAPQTVRKAIVGSGRATKRETALAVATRFPQLRVHLTQDRRWKECYFLNLFDAVALALHHQGEHA